MKEVLFNEYCYKCKYKNVIDTEDPCDACLTCAAREDSHKPIMFEEKDES